MTKPLIIIITLLVVGAVVAWVWSRRRRVVEKPLPDKPQAAEQPLTATGISSFELQSPPQPTPHTTEPESEPSHAPNVHYPEVQPPPSPEAKLAIPAEPATPPLVLPDNPYPAPSGATRRERNVAAREPEQSQPTLAPPPVSNLGKEGTSAPSDTPQCEPVVVETKSSDPFSEFTIPANDSAMQPASADEKPAEPGTLLLSTAAANLSAVFLPESGHPELEAGEDPDPALAKSETSTRALLYHPPNPPAKKLRGSDQQGRTPRPTPRVEADLRLRVQLVFARDGTVKTLALVADWREGMPSEIEIKDTQGELRLTELRDDYYEPLPLVDAGNTLQRGVEWHGCGAARHWRWVLRGRELYVLTSGDVGGLYPYGSSPRLVLNARHVVLAKASLRGQVLAALIAAGCVTPEVSDDTVPSIPSGWVLFREVTPMHAVPMRDEQDILNILCPAHEIEPHFVGGIRLERNVWLSGFPPRIHFTGDFGSGFQVLIDDQPAQFTSDGAVEAPGWNAEGEHRLWFGDQTETYSLQTMDEGWNSWCAYDFGTGIAICGAATHRTDGGRWRQVRIPAANPLLIGARPGEIFHYKARLDVRSETILAQVPFTPVWALPIDPMHADKRSAHLVLLDSIEPIPYANQAIRNRKTDRALRQWIATINDAGRKQLAMAEESEYARALWRRYRTVAKQLRRRMR